MVGGGTYRRALTVGALAVMATFVLAGAARPAGTVTITMLAQSTDKAAFDVLIPNFERVYPGISVNVTYVPSATLSQFEETELAAGSLPDIIPTSDGPTSPISVYELAKAGDLAPMVKKPWATRKRSLPLVTSFSKYGPVLYSFQPGVNPFGVFTNDALFKKLGLTVPQTFSQLLSVCQKAKSDGVVALDMNGGSAIGVAFLLGNLAVAAVYGQDPTWPAKQKAGIVTFESSAGWHKALQDFVDMNNTGCFQPGMVSAQTATEDAEFAAGGALMDAGSSSHKGEIDGSGPGFAYTFHPFPGGTSASQTRTALYFIFGMGVNAHSSATNQAAAQEFVDFVARPKQDELFASQTGNLTQYDFQKDRLPSYMSSFTPVFGSGKFFVDPLATWWNADVLATMENDQIGLVTGQATVDGVLQAMDNAWKEGPSS
jgi:raffinose/stachyose/melibiose transport system substrate-binding protein